MKRIVQTQVAGHTVKYVPMILGNPSGIPLDYTEVEYLENTGTQYIDTGFVYKKAPRIVSEISIISREDKDVLGIIYNVEPSWIVNFYLNELALYNLYYRYGATEPLRRRFTYNLGEWVKIDIGEVFKFGDVSFDTGLPYYDFSTNERSVRLFAGRTVSKCKYKEVFLYDRDDLVRDLIPCIRNSDNKPGMYDKVTNTFFTNSGTGEFITGNILKYSKEGRFN